MPASSASAADEAGGCGGNCQQFAPTPRLSNRRRPASLRRPIPCGILVERLQGLGESRRLVSLWGRQISRAELLQNHTVQFPARERVDEVELHHPDALGAHVVHDAQLVQPIGFGLGQLTQQIVAERLDGIVLGRHGPTIR